MQETLLNAINKVYGEVNNHEQLQRINQLISEYQSYYGTDLYSVLSTPGRTELSGNHTDHNNGKVIAASINLDTVSIAGKSNTNNVVIKSDAYDRPFIVDIADNKVHNTEKGTTTALIRGILDAFQQRGYSLGGFNCVMSSDVKIGSGLSSSASIEISIATILNVLYNNEDIQPIELAKMCQYAENVHFGKPCGLMDQIACALGGIVGIDFKDSANPTVQPVQIDLNHYGFELCIVDTGGNHANLTADYASIPAEMLSVAKSMHKNNCREISFHELISQIPDLRKTVGERPILRAFHFLEENERVSKQIKLLQKGDVRGFLSQVNLSGNSSLKWLQNVYSIQNAHEQPVTLALVLTEHFIKKIGDGAVRIHGGGFAGTILVILPKHSIEQYRALIEPVFGESCMSVLSIRKYGTVRLI